MVNKIVADSFETFGGAVKSAAGQVKQESDTGTSEQAGQQQRQSAQKAVARYRQIQEEIKQLQTKRGQEMVKYNQPGFTDEEKQKNQIKQLEEKPSFAKATDGKNELPPLPVRRASQKTEKLRGVSG